MLNSTVSECSTKVSPKGAEITASLMARHEGLVQWVVRRQYLGGLSFADALHEGRIGLWRALVRYDPSRGTALSTYAVVAIRHAVWNAVAAHRSPVEPGSHPCDSLEPFDPDEFVHAGRLRAMTRALVHRMPERLRLVVVAHYGLGDDEPQSFASIARILGVTRQRVCQIHVEALLYLAHPAHSLPLRRLLERHSRTDYQEALAHQYRTAASGRRRRGASR